jgi:hypothetical protein
VRGYRYDIYLQETYPQSGKVQKKLQGRIPSFQQLGFKMLRELGKEGKKEKREKRKEGGRMRRRGKER